MTQYMNRYVKRSVPTLEQRTPYELRYRRRFIQQPTDVATNEFIEQHLQRRTIRHYDPTRTISRSQLNYLFACAQAAPCSSGAGSWSAIILDNPQDKERFRAAAGEVLSNTDMRNKQAFENCSVYIVWLLDNFKIERGINLVAEKKIPQEVLNLLNSRLKPGAGRTATPRWADEKLFNPGAHTAWLDQSYYGFRALTDCTVAAQTFVMCAESLGLSTMYMGSLAHCDIDSFKNQLNLPDRTFPVFGMCVGWEHPDGSDNNGIPCGRIRGQEFKDNPADLIKPVMPLEAVVHRGHYRPEIIDRYLLEYNQTLWDYSKKVTPGRPSDYLVSRVVSRVKPAVNHLEQMRQMDNKFD